MEYGLRIKDAAGNVTLDAIDKINRVAHTVEELAGNSDSVVLASISGLKTVEMAFPKNVTSFNETPHKVTRSGTTISWSPYGWGATVNKDSLIIVFIYV